jgi:hypothetical protein
MWDVGYGMGDVGIVQFLSGSLCHFGAPSTLRLRSGEPSLRINSGGEIPAGVVYIQPLQGFLRLRLRNDI